MNKFYDLVNRRYSVRKYKNIPVERDKIIACIESAHIAPSACNSQPWEFIVVDDSETKDELIEKTCSGVYSMNSFAKEAPVVIAVLSDRGKISSRFGGMIRHTKFDLIDIGISIEHFILQATEFGLGTCIIGWFDEKRARKILSVDDRKKVLLLLTLGWSNEKKGVKRLRKPIDKIYSFLSKI